ncbi:MAG: DnaJ domain-containing protein [Haloarculaceae archaeon]
MPRSSGGSEPTFYETLGVDEDASREEVRAAYRERAKDTHPDVSDAPDADRRFRRVKRAHDVLSDERERRRYDRLGHEAYLAVEDSRGPGAAGTADPAGSRDRATDDDSRGWTSGADARAGTDPAGSSDPGAGGSTGTRGAGTGAENANAGGVGPGDRRSRRDRSADAGGSAVDGEGSVGRVAYGLARWLRLAGALVDAWQARLGPAGAAIALATFAAYPVLLASTVTPLFPTVVNLLVGLCTFAVLGYLVVRPAVGIAVLGSWLLVLPVALTVSGVGVVSLGGVYSLAVTGVPLVLCVATLAGVSI